MPRRNVRRQSRQESPPPDLGASPQRSPNSNADTEVEQPLLSNRNAGIRLTSPLNHPTVPGDGPTTSLAATTRPGVPSRSDITSDWDAALALARQQLLAEMPEAAELDSQLELRKTPAIHLYRLAQILEKCKGWKALMAVIPNLDHPPELKYTDMDMKMIEESSSQGRTCSEILLDEWGTSGRNRPRLLHLVQFLTEAELFTAADYVSITMLNGRELVRPTEGPAARVRIPGTEELHPKPSAPATSSSDGVSIPRAPTVPSPPEGTLGTPNCISTLEYTGQCEVTRRVCHELSERRGEMQGVRVFSYNELLRGTENFAESLLLGKGGFGTVYLAEWNGGIKMAVKKLLVEGAVVPGLTGNQFSNELLIVAGLSHPNILQLLGYSCDGPELCLVYPFMKNGSLQDRLECKNGTAVLSWLHRLQIAQETANGLQYLHTQRPKALIHRDIKSANVLLAEDFHVKIADFGLVKYGPTGAGQTVAMTTNVLGTSAYMAPEAFRGDVSVKMDVFSFGVVLLELVTGLPPFDEARSGIDLASHVEDVEDFEILLDKRLELEDTTSVRKIYDLALTCLLEKRTRPLIDVVIKGLLQINS